MAGVSETKISGKKILLVDYSGCKANDLIPIFEIAKSIIIDANEPCLILNNFNNTYLTAEFVRHAEKEIVNHLIVRNAFIGMNNPKKMILKGFNMTVNRDFKNFETEQEAFEYLVES